MSEPQTDEIPSDPETIKAHINVRRQAVRMIFAEITVLSERLRNAVGPVEWLRWMQAEAQGAGPNIFGEPKEGQAGGSV